MTSITYAVIDLPAIEHNLNKAREFAPQAKLMAVIKANAYGHGLLQVASAVKQADAVAVARVDEAVRLREANFKMPIMVLEGFNTLEELDAFVKYDLETVIHCKEQLVVLQSRVEQASLTVWIKLDTGMNRLGFKVDDFPDVYQALKESPKVAKIRFMTHLANADEMEDNKTPVQLELFKQTLQNYQEEQSIANSAGLLAWKDAISDWVRPGIMLYGISPFAEKTGIQLGLKPAMTLYSQLIAIKEINKGETVGYSGTWMANKKTRLGLVAIGYGDGYPRHAKNGTPVLVNNQRVSLTGRVSMDMLAIDLGFEHNFKVGDRVTLWGKGLPIEEIALCADTIPYTLTCGVTQRVVKSYETLKS